MIHLLTGNNVHHFKNGENFFLTPVLGGSVHCFRTAKIPIARHLPVYGRILSRYKSHDIIHFWTEISLFFSRKKSQILVLDPSKYRLDFQFIWLHTAFFSKILIFENFHKFWPGYNVVLTKYFTQFVLFNFSNWSILRIFLKVSFWAILTNVMHVTHIGEIQGSWIVNCT